MEKANSTFPPFDQLVSHFKRYTSEGKCASYIPALAKVHASHLGITIIEPNGSKIQAGEYHLPFTMQSISKVLCFITVCMEHGISYVMDKVDVEPTGDPFHSFIRLEMLKPEKPFNPMINAGAITVASLLTGKTPQSKLEYFYNLHNKLLGKQPVLNEHVFQSEWNTAHRNRALAYYLKDLGFLESDVETTLEVYFKQCSFEVNTEDIAIIGLVLACDGYNPFSEEQIIPKKIARLAKSLMLTCGMYNASGKFAAFIGIPAKSGVSGGIMALSPARNRTFFPEGCGIGIYGPAIDDLGNSAAGVKLLEYLVNEYDLSIF